MSDIDFDLELDVEDKHFHGDEQKRQRRARAIVDRIEHLDPRDSAIALYLTKAGAESLDGLGDEIGPLTERDLQVFLLGASLALETFGGLLRERIRAAHTIRHSWLEAVCSNRDEKGTSVIGSIDFKKAARLGALTNLIAAALRGDAR